MEPKTAAMRYMENWVPKAYISAGVPSIPIDETKETKIERATGMTWN